MTRRSFVLSAAAAASLSCFSPNFLASSSEKRDSAGVMDQALELFAQTGPEYGGGLANHGPMAAEALIALGRPNEVIPWVERYKRKLQSHPEAQNPISGENWREALGDYKRVGDWIALFNREMKERSWQSVLGEWVERLAPGLIAAATHGLIRTGHAARSLAERETEARKQELAEGLGYWAARYQLLPMSRDGISKNLKPSQAIKQVEVLPNEKRTTGLISESLRSLNNFPPFAGVINLVDTSIDASSFISDLTETFAGLYLTNSQNFRNVITFLHAITGPSAIRLLLQHLTPEAKRSALRYGWQAAAAIYAGYGIKEAETQFEKREQNREDLIDRAVAAVDEHAIKFTEACLREHALNPKPIYLLAARNAIDRLRR